MPKLEKVGYGCNTLDANTGTPTDIGILSDSEDSEKRPEKYSTSKKLEEIGLP